MTTPLDIGAAILGASGLAMQIFQGCLEGYRMFHDAQQIGNEGDLLRLKLRIQQARLQDWGRVSGIESTRPNQRLNWALIQDVLEHQHGILTVSETVREYYSLDQEVVREEATEAKERPESKPTGISRLIASIRPELYSKAASSIYTSSKPLKRIRWALVGSKTLNKIINDLSELNSGLVQLLEPVQQDQLWDALKALYQDLISGSSTLSDVDVLAKAASSALVDNSQPLQAAAEFKKLRLLLAWDKREDEVRPQNPPPTFALKVNKRLKSSKLELSDSQKRQSLVLTKYGHTCVLVEWRRVPAGLFKVYRPYLEDLAFLLGNASVSFAALNCFGHVVLENESLWGYVYEIPPSLAAGEDRSGVAVKTLRQLIQETRHIPLRLRVRIAIVVAKAVLELHTAGWLHKSIRSDKVIFVHEKGSTNRALVTQQPFLLGYEAARKDSKYGVALSETMELGLEDQLYNHPHRRGDEISTVRSFRKLHDLYALGCLLTEIALWQPLTTVCTIISGTDWHLTIQEAESSNAIINLPSLTDYIVDATFCDTVEHFVNSQYLEAIRLCVQTGGLNEYDADLSVSTEREVLASLKACEDRNSSSKY